MALKEYSINEKIFIIAQINETKATIVTTPSLVLLITTSVNESIYLYTSGLIGKRLKRELTINSLKPKKPAMLIMMARMGINENIA